MKFTVEKKDTGSSARAGRIETDHGTILTPIFMPVGTVGSVKGVDQNHLREDVRAQVILGNTYHLFLRPGNGVMQAAGGLHRFMHWDGPILTDSGGYQVFSLSAQRKLSEEGATFQSHIDGSKHLFTPENVVDTQRVIGSDIMMVLDECPPWPSEEPYVRTSMALTHRWAQRCKQHWQETEGLYGHSQALFPIVQGGMFRDLRRASSEATAGLDLPGNAIGGLSVGEPTELMYEMCALCCSILPEDKPRYLMGVGTPENLLENIALGVDMFDCVMPTRNARHGMMFTREGIRNMHNRKYALDFSPLDPDSDLFTDGFYSKAYVRHLLKGHEMLAMMILSLHNLHFYLWLVGEARRHILEGDFWEWKRMILPRIGARI